ncbi:MAG TPA: ABC transporter substrate-binding protein [Acidobacteriota bacterium]
MMKKRANKSAGSEHILRACMPAVEACWKRAKRSFAAPYGRDVMRWPSGPSQQGCPIPPARWKRALPGLALLWIAIGAAAGQNAPARAGGTLVLAHTSEPKTLNPLLAADQPTRDILYAMSADLVHINRATQRTEPALAKSWSVSRDGRRYTLVLRDGLRFSDGLPLTADDVVFTFRAYLDPKLNSPQRDVLLVEGKPITFTKLSARSIRVDLPAPYAPGERLFDSFWILPKHRLERAYIEGRLSQVWGTASAPSEVVTAGPFRLRQYVPGQRLMLERNPYYWKKDESDRPLPYLDSLQFVFVGDQNAQLLRLIAGEVNAAARLRAEDFSRLEKIPFLRAYDAGPGLEYNFLFFNWDASGPAEGWFRNVKFRQAVAHAVDRDAIVRLVYQGRGSAIWSQVTPGNRLWRTEKLTRYPHDLARAEQLLREINFHREPSGILLDNERRPVEFTLMVSSSNQLRRKMATLVQEDLSRLGMQVHLSPIEFGAMMDAVLKTRKFEAGLWALVSGDADPNSEMNVWSSSGTLHIWNLQSGQSRPRQTLEPWEQDVDRLMRLQMTSTDFNRRKAAYDQVQQLLSENLPLIFLVSPHVLAVAHRNLGNVSPAVMEPALLWNCDRLFWMRPPQ